MKCNSCGRDGLSASDFNKNSSRATGLQSRCRNCDRSRSEGRRAQNPEVAPKKVVEENEKLKKMVDAFKTMTEHEEYEISPAPINQGTAVACCILSDWHVEEPVERAKVHGLNEFNLKIAEARATAVFANLLRLAQLTSAASDVKVLYLAMIGDFISGHIHEELQETNLLGPAEAAQMAMGLLRSGIEFLLDRSDFQLEIDCVPGNHGRMTKKVRIQNATETSLESFMFHALAQCFAGNPRVNFRIAKSKMMYREFFKNFTLRVIHGDDIKFGGGVGGITIPIRKKLAAWDKAKRADLTLMGHFHQLINGGDFIVNGSLIGYNEFAQAIGASPEEPRQAFFVLNNRKGNKLGGFFPVWVETTKWLVTS